MKKNKQTNNTQTDSFSNKKQTSKKNSSAQIFNISIPIYPKNLYNNVKYFMIMHCF